jgi:hypothetical protein
MVTVPSAELRQGLRLAILSGTSAAERAGIVGHLLREMAAALASSADGSELDSPGLLDLAAAAELLDRQRDATGLPDGNTRP